MLSKAQLEELQGKALVYLEKTGIALTREERGKIEVADFGLSQPEIYGLEIVVYVNTSRCCAKELVLLPGQICPEHRHPPVNSEPGKEETFRCRSGQVYLYVPGTAADSPKAIVPVDAKQYFTVWHEVILNPGEQYTLSPNTRHWFQGGPEGAVVSEFSTTSRDECDIFTDSRILRDTKILE
jgi:D-lyxose ketol-isomerase